MISLAGQATLITGGTRGIGRATALLFARAGADVGVTYHRRKADAEVVAKQVREMGRRTFFAGGDLADPRVVEQVFRECKVAFGGLDCFVAQARLWAPGGGPPPRAAAGGGPRREPRRGSLALDDGAEPGRGVPDHESRPRADEAGRARGAGLEHGRSAG